MVWVFSSIISQVLLLCFIFYFLLPGFVSPPFFLLICVPVLLLHPFLLLFWTKAHPFGVPLSLVGRAGGPIPEALSLLQSLPLSLILLPITSSAILSKSHERPKKYKKKKKALIDIENIMNVCERIWTIWGHSDADTQGHIHHITISHAVMHLLLHFLLKVVWH